MNQSLLSASKHASASTAVDESQLPASIPARHRGRIFRREVHVVGTQVQYLCLYEDGNCLASSPSLEHLAAAIERREAYDLETPADYDPALDRSSYSFAKSIANQCVMHEVRDASSQIVGIGVLRSEAVHMAATVHHSRRPLADLALAELGQVTYFANVTSLGRQGVVYAGDGSAMAEIRSAAKLIWYLDREVQAKHPDLKVFLRWFPGAVLRTPTVQDGGARDVVQLVYSAKPMSIGLHLVFAPTQVQRHDALQALWRNSRVAISKAVAA